MMGLLMTFQGSGLVECFLTDVANVWPCTGVNPLMTVEMREVGEPFATSTAHIRLDRQVDSLVVLQIIHLEE